MFERIRNWRTRRLVARHPIAEELWREALQRCRAAHRLGASDQATLRVLATLFLQRKWLEPAQGLELSDADRVLLAAHACLPILKLGIGWYDGWHSVIVYPAAFMARREKMDVAGVVHQARDLMAGEAWNRGPVILSWDDVQTIGRHPGHNVVVHEMANKLDMLNGDADGFPPLHRRMNRRMGAGIHQCLGTTEPGPARRHRTADRSLRPGKPRRILRRPQRTVLRNARRLARTPARGLSTT